MASQAERRARILQLQARARRAQQAAPAVSMEPSVSAFDETAIAPIPTAQQVGASAGRLGRGIDDIVRSIASGAIFGFADELAAAANTATGLGTGATYAENVAAERARDVSIPPSLAIPGQIAGAIGTGAGLGRAGLSLMRGAAPNVGSMATRGAAEGAAYGAAHGAGQAEGGFDARLNAAQEGAATGALMGGVLGAAGGRIAQGMQPQPPTVQQLRQQSSRLYDQALGSGRAIEQSRFSSMVDNLEDAMKAEGYRPRLYPRIREGLAELDDARGSAPTLMDLDSIRRVFQSARASIDPAERRMARLLVERYDDAVDDALGGVPELAQARAIWQRASKGDTVEELITRARESAPNFTGSGMENALRTEFRSLAKNPKRMRLFNQEEQKAIRRVARGGPIENALRMIGKFAPTGVVSTGISGGLGFGVGGPVGAVALPAAGYAARSGATALTTQNAQRALDLMRRGGPPVTIPPNPLLIDMIRSGITGGAPVAAGINQ